MRTMSLRGKLRNVKLREPLGSESVQVRWELSSLDVQALAKFLGVMPYAFDRSVGKRLIGGNFVVVKHNPQAGAVGSVRSGADCASDLSDFHRMSFGRRQVEIGDLRTGARIRRRLRHDFQQDSPGIIDQIAKAL